MKKLIFIPVVILIVSVLSCGNSVTSVETEVAVPVSVMDIKTGSIEKYINTTGTVAAAKEVSLKNEMSGKYMLLNNPSTGTKYKLGNTVQQGSTIISIEDEEYKNNIALESQKLSLDISEQEFKKQESLYKKGGVTLRELRNAEVSYMNAKYAYEKALLQTAYMYIKAPFKGLITDLPYYTPNTKVATGQDMLTLMDYSTLLMEANFPEKYISEVVPGIKLRVMNYSMPDDTLNGTIKEVSPAINSETRTFKGKLQIENPGLKLRPGMFVKADIIIAKKDSVIVIPKDAIISGPRGKVVYVVEKGTAIERVVTFGYENQDNAEITSGLKLNDRLIIKGFETLRNRSKVKVVK